MFRPVRAAGVIVLAVTLLSGCSLIGATSPATDAPSAAAQSQTEEEACNELRPVLVDVGTRLNDAYGELQADPSKASPLLHDVSDDLHTAIDGLENQKILDLANTAVDSLDAMIVEIDAAIAGNPDNAALLAAATKVQTDFSAIDPVCQAATEG